MNPEETASPKAEAPRAISREEMAQLPIRRYEGEICLVVTPSDLQQARIDLLQEEVIGFDTETRPAFARGERYLPSLVQAATARRVYLFQLHRPQVFETIAGLLAEASTYKAGIGLAHDVSSLKLLFPFIERNVIDLGILARHRHMKQTGLRNLAGIFLGYRVPKGARTSNWAAPHLTSAQLAYAATDAWICRELFLQFRQKGWIDP